VGNNVKYFEFARIAIAGNIKTMRRPGNRFRQSSIWNFRLVISKMLPFNLFW